VARERGLSPEQARALADGRAMTGRKALEAGLVDRMGDFQDALGRAAELGNFPADAAPDLITGPEKPLNLLREFLGVLLDNHLGQGMLTVQPVFMY
jgi:protease-4